MDLIGGLLFLWCLFVQEWYLVDMYHPAELTWQWKITMFDRRYILRLLFFQCHLRFRGCNLVQDVFPSENGDIPASYVSLPEAS